MTDIPGLDTESKIEREQSMPETGLTEVDTLPFRLGFVESAELSEVRERAASALLNGDVESYRVGLNEYDLAARAQVDGLSDSEDRRTRPRAQVGIMVTMAALKRDGGEPAMYVADLIDADTLASQMGLDEISAVLGAEISKFYATGELQEAQGDFDGALDRYVDRENGDLSEHERGLLNLRILACSGVTLDNVPQDLEPELHETLQSALLYLEGEPEEGKALKILNMIERADT